MLQTLVQRNQSARLGFMPLIKRNSKGVVTLLRRLGPIEHDLAVLDLLCACDDLD
jgi:hypothetical protein